MGVGRNLHRIEVNTVLPCFHNAATLAKGEHGAAEAAHGGPHGEHAAARPDDVPDLSEIPDLSLDDL